MRHVYVGDVGDFGKFGLLRALLHGSENLKLGVAWYLMDEHEHNNDGKHDSYLCVGTDNVNSSYRDCDADLYDRLKQIRGGDRLDVSMLEEGSVLPESTVFAKETIPVNATTSQRSEWHARSKQVLSECEVVFVDPDNGIKWQNPTPKAAWSHKHVYWSEILDFLDAGKSVVVYHHLNRNGSHEEQVQSGLGTLATYGHPRWAVRYRRGTSRVFSVIPNRSHQEKLNRNLLAFGKNWKNHADVIQSIRFIEST